MNSTEKVIAVMRGLQQAVEDRGWCLVEGEVGVGKTHSLQEALHQLGWESVWKGPMDLDETSDAFNDTPPEILVFDGLTEEWAPSKPGETPTRGWNRLYNAITVAMARAQGGLLTVVCTDSNAHAEHIDKGELTRCVGIALD